MTAATRLALPAVCMFLGASGASAATKTTTFLVQAQITADCSITANDLNFGSLGVLSANNDATTTLTATCSNTTPYNVGLNAGSVAGSTVATRLLGNGTATLAFQLYRDAARTQVWGITVGTDTSSGTGTGSAQTMQVYGRIPSQANTPAPGTYSSTITVTITY